MRTIVQITAFRGSYGSGIYALDDKGKVWYYYGDDWQELPPLPENDK